MPALLAALILAAAPAAPVRPDAVGDVYRYRSETRYAERTRDDVSAQVNSQVFEVQVLAVGAEGLKLRYTLKEATVADTAGPAMKAPLLATVGIPLEFHVDRQGLLTSLDNWPAFHDRMLANIDKALPAGDEVRNIVHQRMDQPPTDAAQDMVLGDLATLRGVELHGPVMVGRVVSRDFRRRPPSDVVTETSVKTPGCVARVVRVATGSSANITQKTTAEAEVSLKDGRVLSFSQTRVERAGGAVVDERLKITRLSAAPGCP